MFRSIIGPVSISYLNGLILPTMAQEAAFDLVTESFAEQEPYLR